MQRLIIAVILVLVSGSFMSVAEAALVTTNCGPILRSISKTNNGVFNTTSEGAGEAIPGAVPVNVPAGETRCVKLRFSAVAACPASCYLRAVAISDGTEIILHPNTLFTGTPLRLSNDAPGSEGTAHSFEWARRLPPGNYAVQILVASGTSASAVRLGPYTIALDILE
jgi:hypothetical protein